MFTNLCLLTYLLNIRTMHILVQSPSGRRRLTEAADLLSPPPYHRPNDVCGL